MAQGLLQVTPERKQSKPPKQEPEKGHSWEGTGQVPGLDSGIEPAAAGQWGQHWCYGREWPGVREMATRLERSSCARLHEVLPVMGKKVDFKEEQRRATEGWYTAIHDSDAG